MTKGGRHEILHGGGAIGYDADVHLQYNAAMS